MKKLMATLLIVTPLTFSLSGCVVSIGGEDGHNYSSDFENREYDNRKKIARLPLNTSFESVYHDLGVADFNETYQANGKNVQVLYYRTHRKHKDGLTTKDECTYLNFVDGLLTETGNGANYMRASAL